jgi:hypothetical protein
LQDTSNEIDKNITLVLWEDQSVSLVALDGAGADDNITRLAGWPNVESLNGGSNNLTQILEKLKCCWDLD